MVQDLGESTIPSATGSRGWQHWRGCNSFQAWSTGVSVRLSS